MKTSKADAWFSKFIRLRDADENACAKCCTCGAYKSIKEMDCGHFIKRQHMATRFSEINCATQCKKCNAFEQGRDVDFERYILDRWGEEKLNILKSSKRSTVHYTQFGLNWTEELYKQKATELSKLKGIELW